MLTLVQLERLPWRLAQWARQILAAAEAHRVDPLLLAAIMDRETLGGTAPQLSVPGPSGTGDHGHGRGLMQVDDRAHASWLACHDWTDPAQNIDYGAAVLAEGLRTFPGCEPGGIAAYNCGARRVRKVLQALGEDEDWVDAFDALTTGGNYVSDVIERRRKLRHNCEWYGSAG